ncbi:cyclic nucleotide-binding domain-containing protein [Ditylenchus destructor]|uniref:Cyclic nucleotide-binding domain-containing protein n=1 Tax=Ditylenchus destructor TaxID=166010 RepID=A0AAD4RDQ5_9BILA|nr:cyclic nucleotide-binding domain-containing protein [Ditylenchus destructor]
MTLPTLGLSDATSYIIFSLSGAALVAYLLYKYFDIRSNDIDEFRRRTSSSVSASEEKDVVLSRTPTPPNGFRRRLRRNPFKAIYSNIVRRQSVSQNTNSTGLPHVLQRRHSTVFPLQVAKAAKDLFRGRGPFPYRRQMSEACRDAVLPQPPLEFFEPSAQVDIPDDLRPLFYIHHNIKLLELPPSWILNREDIDILEFEANSYIARPGDEDDSVSLKATQPSKVAKFNFRRFQKSYQENPERLDERGFDDRHRNVSGHSMKLSGKYKPRQRRLSSSDDSSELFSTAIRWVGEALKINFSDAQNILQTRMKIISFDEDQVVVEQGSDDNPLLIMVLSGALKISQECPADSDDMEENSWNKLIYPKELYGGLQLLSHEPSFFTARAACATTIAVINQQEFDEIVSIMPSVVLPVAHAVVRRLSSFIRAVDFAIDWELLDSGQAVYR